MAAVNEEITGYEESAEFTPTETVSEVVIEGNHRGEVQLQELVPSGQWKMILNKPGSYVIPTPDVAIIYKFVAFDVQKNTRVYMGP